jgi:uncharacterized membrane protein YeaQ/YmgE (transglycosylase-associated protein family)
MTIYGLLLMAGVSGLCTLVAAVIASGRLPGGISTAVLVGMTGAWLGSHIVGSFGPTVAGISLLPSILGSSILVFTVAMFSDQSSSF